MTTPTPTPPAKPRKFWQRPIVWIVTLVVGAVGAYLTDVGKSVLDSLLPAQQLGEQLSGNDAIGVVDMVHVYDNTEGAQGYVVAKNVPADDLMTFEEVGRWAKANHAVDLERSTWEVTLEGKRSSPVEVVNIAVVLEEPCRPPLKGGLIDEGSEGETDKILLTVEVSSPRPVFARSEILSTDTPEPPIPNYFATKKITLPKGEKNVLVLVGYAYEKYCRWRYRVEYLADGKRDSLIVSAPGNQPFEVTSPLVGIDGRRYRGYDWYVPSLASGCYNERWGGTQKRPRMSAEDFEANCLY